LASKTTRLSRSVAVIGMGRFGRSLALELMADDVEVLAVDADDHVVQSLTGRLTHVVTADSTDEEALRQLSLHEFKRAVVAIGTDLEASILTTSILVDFGIPNIWAKAISTSHAKILSKVGAHHVVRPEHDMGRRVAHLVRGKLQDYIEFEDGYAIAKAAPPSYIWGVPLSQSSPRTRYGVTIVGVKRAGSGFTHATPDTVVRHGDIIIVSGPRDQVEEFSNLE
jgi:trk system potassium uptake protein TrkA